MSEWRAFASVLLGVKAITMGTETTVKMLLAVLLLALSLTLAETEGQRKALGVK